MIQLFDYQESLVADIRASLLRSRRTLAVSPTGSGKTVMFSYMTSRARERGRRIGIFAHRAELIQQISDSLRSFSVPHGIIGAGGRTIDKRHSVFVISAQTYARSIDRMPTFDLGIIDEAHHCTGGSTWGKCMANSPDARWIGVTATPERLDGRGLAESFDEMAMGPTVRQLIDAGRLSDYRLFAPGGIDLSGVHMLGGDYNKGELNAAVDKPSVTGDAVAHYRKYLDGAPTAAFCVSIAHAHHVAAEFSDAGYAAASIDGKMDRVARKRMVDDFKAGRLQVLTSCDLISEGFDLPGMMGAILLRPTKSLALYLQQVGRALRVAPGKTKATILDHAGNSFDTRHGLPCLDREWSLEGRKKAAVAAVPSMSRECGVCYARFPLTRLACPECGTACPVRVREIEQVAGELEEVAVEEKRKAPNPLRVAQGRAKTLQELEQIALERGYKPGWARHILEARNGNRKRKTA